MRTGSNQRSWGERRRKRKNGISRARAIPGKKVTEGSGGRGRDGQARQKAHDGGLGDGVAEASRALSEAVVAVLSAPYLTTVNGRYNGSVKTKQWNSQQPLFFHFGVVNS